MRFDFLGILLRAVRISGRVALSMSFFTARVRRMAVVRTE